MAYSDAEIAKVRQAIIDLTTGDRATMITKDGRTVQYQRASLPDLRSQLSVMITANQSDKPGRRSRTCHAVTSKGL